MRSPPAIIYILSKPPILPLVSSGTVFVVEKACVLACVRRERTGVDIGGIWARMEREDNRARGEETPGEVVGRAWAADVWTGVWKRRE